jgi:hypothetical protein
MAFEYIVDKVPYVSQENPRVCWKASYKMMLGWKDGKVQSAADSLPGKEEMEKRGILDSEFLPCRQALGLSSTTYTVFQDLEKLTNALKMYGPIWVSGFFADGNKHIMVLRGAREGYISDPEVYVNDPFRGWSGAEARPSWWAFSKFKSKLNPVSYACQHWL